MVDSDLVQDIFDIDGMDYHWIVYEGGLNIEKPKYKIKKYFENLIMFDVYSWGSNPKDKSRGYLRKRISINHFKLNYYGYIICK